MWINQTWNSYDDIKNSSHFSIWFWNSEVVDENWDPLLLYHWSRFNFPDFNDEKAGTNRDSWFFWKWHYFTPHKWLAIKYWNNLYSVYCRCKKLAVFESYHANSRNFSFETLPDYIDKEKFQELYWKRFAEKVTLLEDRTREIQQQNPWWWAWIDIPQEDEFQEDIISELLRELLIEEGYDWVKAYNPISWQNEYVVFHSKDILIVWTEWELDKVAEWNATRVGKILC